VCVYVCVCVILYVSVCACVNVWVYVRVCVLRGCVGVGACSQFMLVLYNHYHQNRTLNSLSLYVGIALHCEMFAHARENRDQRATTQRLACTQTHTSVLQEEVWLPSPAAEQPHCIIQGSAGHICGRNH
jgi:hypothetical protein